MTKRAKTAKRSTKSRKPAAAPRLWTTREGVKIAPKDMGDQHLLNTVRMCERLAEKTHTEELTHAYQVWCMLQGEMATMECDRAISELESTDPTERLPDIYWDLRAEIERRGLKPLSLT